MDFVRRWSEKTEISAGRFIHWLGVTASKFYNWRERYGRANEHNGWVPRDFWLEPWEKEAIVSFHLKNPLEGYRRLTFMMLDADVVAVSPASVWRVLKQAGLLSRWKSKPSRKGTGFEQPLAPHQHWHVDVSYINLSGTFYYLCSVLDGCSRFLVHWDLRESMKEADIEKMLQDPGIIRSRAKIEATIGGAKAYLEMQKSGVDFSEFVWKMAGGKPIKNKGPVPTQTPLSVKFSKEFKKRGFKFVGPVIVYAWMQAVGIVDDHAPDCHRRK